MNIYNLYMYECVHICINCNLNQITIYLYIYTQFVYEIIYKTINEGENIKRNGLFSRVLGKPLVYFANCRYECLKV